MSTQTFRTSTPRVIGVELDLHDLRLRYWIDGKPLDDMSRKLPPGKSWIPTVVFQEKDLEVILNPFCVSSDDFFSSGLIARAPKELHDDTMNGGQHSMPACLSRPISIYQSSFLASQLSRYIVAFNLEIKGEDGKTYTDEELIYQIKNWYKKDYQAPGKKPEKVEDKKEDEKEDSKAEGPPVGEIPNEEAKVEEIKTPEKPKEVPEEKPQSEEVDKFPTFEVEILPIKEDEPAVKTEEKADEKADPAKTVKTRMVLLKFESDQAAFKYLIAAKEYQVIRKSLYLIFLSGVSMSKILKAHHLGEAGIKEMRAHHPGFDDPAQFAANLTQLVETTKLITDE